MKRLEKRRTTNLTAALGEKKVVISAEEIQKPAEEKKQCCGWYLFVIYLSRQNISDFPLETFNLTVQSLDLSHRKGLGTLFGLIIKHLGSHLPDTLFFQPVSQPKSSIKYTLFWPLSEFFSLLYLSSVCFCFSVVFLSSSSNLPSFST